MLIAQITDIHLGFDPGNPDEFNRKRLDQVLGRLMAMDPRPDLLLATGDLVDRGDVESYRRLSEAMAAIAMPVRFCLGNHDIRASFTAVYPEAPMAEGFHQYAFDQGGLRFLVLDTLEEGRHGGAFCETRARWLSARLAERSAEPTVIVMHHPPVEVGIPWMNTDPDEPWVARFRACVAGRRQIVAIICGHVHRPILCGWEGSVVSVCASTAPQIALELADLDPDRPDDRPMIITDPPAYAIHRWDGAQLVTHFETAEDHLALARFDAQMQPLVKSLMGERPAPQSPPLRRANGGRA